MIYVAGSEALRCGRKRLCFESLDRGVLQVPAVVL